MANPRFDGADWAQAQPVRIGEGYGLDGTLLRVVLPAAATPSVVVKLCKRAFPDTEPHFYREIAPRMPVRLVECYASDVDVDTERFVLVLEDLALADAHQGDCLVGDTKVRLRAVVSGIARYHALFWGGRDPVLSVCRRFVVKPDNVLSDLAGYKARFLDRWQAVLEPGAAARIDELAVRVPEAASILAAAEPTFMHSDLHLDNVMFIGDEPVYLDWPDGRIGPGVVDLGRVLLEGMTLAQRRERQSDLIALYRSTLEAQGVARQSDAVFYEQLSAYCAWVCCTTLHWGGKASADFEHPRVAEIVRSHGSQRIRRRLRWVAGAGCDTVGGLHGVLHHG